jgi:hypothetical protein
LTGQGRPTGRPGLTGGGAAAIRAPYATATSNGTPPGFQNNILLDLREPSHPVSIPPRRLSPSARPTYLGLTVTVVNRSDEPKRLRVLGDELVLSEGISTTSICGTIVERSGFVFINRPCN